MPDTQPATHVATPPVAPSPQSAPLVAPAPAAGKRSCFGTVLIIIATVICTIIAEIVIGFFAIGYFAKTAWQKIQNELSVTTTFSAPAGGATGGTGTSLPLTKDQQALLNSLGIKASDLPAELSPQKIACFQNAVGADRIQQIISGKATPSITDLFRAKSCL